MPVTLVSIVPNVVVLHPKVPINSIKELIEYAKANPDKLNYASAGNGTSHHLAPELFKIATGTKLNHVPYKGAGPAMQDLIAGQVDLMFDGMGSSAPQIRGGKLKPLAVTTPTRSPAFPDVPTLQELGVPGYEVTTWYGLWAPAGTPATSSTSLQQEVAKAMLRQEIKDIWAAQGAGAGGNTPEQFAAFITYRSREVGQGRQGREHQDRLVLGSGVRSTARNRLRRRRHRGEIAESATGLTGKRAR